MKTHINQLLDRFAQTEDDFRRTEFLAPALRGGVVSVRIAGVVCRLHVSGSFEGWGVFRPEGLTRARLVRPATLAERRRYLALLPRRRFILCARHRRYWLAWPADYDQRYGPPRLHELYLVEGAEPFDTIIARSDGARYWFEAADERADPAAAAYLRRSLADGVAPEHVRRPGLPGEARVAYAATVALREEMVRDQTEARLKGALAHAGAELTGYVERDGAFRIEFTVDGVRHVSVVGADDLGVQLAGICLSGEDQRFDLSSLVGVLREADDVLRIGDGGLAEETYWDIHPRR